MSAFTESRSRIFDLARSRILARSDFRRAKDRLVLDSFSRREIFISHWIGAVNRKNGFSNPGGARLVNHI